MMKRMMASFLLMKNIWEILSHKKHLFQQQRQHQSQAVILTYSNDIEYQVEDISYHCIMYNTKKSDRYNPFKQDMSLFTNIVTKVVGTCPFNINGNKMYQMKCDESTWKEKLTEGGHWQINWGKTSFSMVKEE